MGEKIVRFKRRRESIRPRRSKGSEEIKAEIEKVDKLEAEREIASTMDSNNYQWGYQSIYQEDVISVAAAQLAAWKE
ncbi:hypothetical protein ACLOJK_022671 [Asimina triloba]